MTGPGEAFVKGGCGCLGAFFVVAVLALLSGGRVHFDPCGGLMLFGGGGVLGLGAHWIYQKGRTNALEELHGRSQTSDFDSPSGSDRAEDRQ